MGRITWTDDRHGAVGAVGKLHLFTISYKSRRDDPSWIMQCKLLGFDFEYHKSNDMDELKATAEEILTAFVAELGATFNDAEEDR